ncbi:MAG: MFS transporter, partial [Candidatus Lambdaproteobacteria bacterium]|nr:MFS transporter [Candidatus Lambdaproteobacteria bacterium]
MTQTVAANSVPVRAPDVPQRVVNINFVKLNVAMFMLMINMSMFNLLPYYLELRGASQSFYGAVAGAMGVSNFLAMAFYGHRADQWSRRSSVLIYLIPMFLGNFVAIGAMFGDLNWYFLSRLLHGLFMGLGFPIMFAWVVELTPPERKHETLALFGVGGLMSNTVGPLIAELILGAQADPTSPDGYLPVFIAGTLISVLGAAAVMITPNRFAPPLAAGEKPSLLPMLRRNETKLLLLITIVFGGMFGVYVNFGKNFVADLGLTYVSVLFGTYTGGAILSRVLIRPVTAIVRQNNLIPVGLLGVAATFVMLSLSGGYWGLAMSGLFYGLGHGILFPALFVRFIDMQKKSESGRSTILYQGMFSAGWGALPYVGGLVVQQSSFQSLYAALAALCGFAMLVHQMAERMAGQRKAREEAARA